MDDRRQVDLDPDTVPLSSDHAAAEGRLFVVAERHDVRWLRVEAGIICPGSVRNPAFDHQVATDFVGVVAKVEAVVGHDPMLPPPRPGPYGVSLRLGEVAADACELGRGRLGEHDGPMRMLPGW